MVGAADGDLHHRPESLGSVSAGSERLHHRRRCHEGGHRHGPALRRCHAGGGSDCGRLYPWHHLFRHQVLSGLWPGHAAGAVHQGAVLFPVGSGPLRHPIPDHPHHQRREPTPADDADASADHHHHPHPAHRRHHHVPETGRAAQRDSGVHRPHYRRGGGHYHHQIPSLVQEASDPGGRAEPGHAGKAHGYSGHPGLRPHRL